MNPLTARVVDEHGAPIPGALVFLTTANDADPTKPGQFQSLNPQITNSAGEIVFFNSPVTKSRIQIAATAAGYKPAESFDGNPLPTYDGSKPLTITLTLATFKRPFKTAPRFWKANMCGIRIPGLPAIPGGSSDPSVFLSWFYDRYSPEWQSVIRRAMANRGLTHWLISWPDSQDFGKTPEQFKAMCQELIAAGFFPCPMLSAKPTSSSDIRSIEDTLANILLVLPLLIGIIPLACVGWELSLFMTPEELQWLIDQLAPMITPSGCRLYIHLQEGYSSYQSDGGFFADFWNRNVGKLTGILRQKLLKQDHEQYRYDSGGIWDVLTRFAGNYNVAPDSGFGHPFDDVELEITATFQYWNGMSEAEGNSWGTWAIDTPAAGGPAGQVSVMGSGNGAIE